MLSGTLAIAIFPSLRRGAGRCGGRTASRDGAAREAGPTRRSASALLVRLPRARGRVDRDDVRALEAPVVGVHPVEVAVGRGILHDDRDLIARLDPFLLRRRPLGHCSPPGGLTAYAYAVTVHLNETSPCMLPSSVVPIAPGSRHCVSWTLPPSVRSPATAATMLLAPVGQR